MRLWVDDERAPTGEDDWVWAKTSADALRILQNPAFGEWTEIALDHDLGGDDTTRPVVLWMCENDRWPSIVRVLSMNPVGREWIEGMVERYGPGVTP